MTAGSQKQSVLHLPTGRLSYPNLAEARSFEEGQEAKYGCTVIFDAVAKSDPSFATMMAKVMQAVMQLAHTSPALAKFRGSSPQETLGKNRSPFRDGGEGDFASKAGYGPGTMFIRASSTRKIPCVGRDLVPVTDISERFYPGCYVRALVMPFSYTKKGNHGVSFGLRGVQFVKDGERLDDMVDVSKEFEALDDPTEATPFDTAGGDATGALAKLMAA